MGYHSEVESIVTIHLCALNDLLLAAEGSVGISVVMYYV